MYSIKRQSPRVRIDVEVRILGQGRTYHALGVEIGAGGMSLENADALSVSEPVQVSFPLPSGEQVTVQAVVWWKRKNLTGLRFDPSDPRRTVLDDWIQKEQGPG